LPCCPSSVHCARAHWYGINKLKNITLTADIALIAQARAKARARNATLNDEFRIWLAKYVNTMPPQEAFHDLMRSLSHVKAGQSYPRDAANER